MDKYNVTVLGTPIQAIMNTEDRERFKEEIESIGEKVAPSRAATTVEDAASAAEKVRKAKQNMNYIVFRLVTQSWSVLHMLLVV